VRDLLDSKGQFNLMVFVSTVLNQTILVQSNVLIIFALVFLEVDNLQSLTGFICEHSTLYDVDMMYMLTYLQPKQQYLSKLTTVSFKNSRFESNSINEKFNDVPKLDFALLFNIPNISSINLSYSNFIQAISDDNLKVLSERLRGLPPQQLKYLGLAGVMPDYVNIRKYRLLLESMPQVEKLNISYNIILPKPITESVLFQVKDLKMTSVTCQSLQINVLSKSHEIDHQFLEIA
jgi:hypothetical protein